MAGERPFDTLLAEAEERLLSEFRASTSLDHSGTKGTAREEGVGDFLRSQLPSRFAVATGEAIDSGGRRTTQLDVIVYDQVNVSPLWPRANTALLPAEALLAVVEVKTKLTRDEVAKCFRAVKSLRKLRPDGKEFTDPRTDGAAADDDLWRCMYTVVAFSSDLTAKEWPGNEWERFLEVAAEEGVSPALIERVLILDRGLVMPGASKALSASEGQKRLLGSWFLHLSQFLSREVPRRSAFEWESYRKGREDWQRLAPKAPKLATEPVSKKKPIGRSQAGRSTSQGRIKAATSKRRGRRPPKKKN